MTGARSVLQGRPAGRLALVAAVLAMGAACSTLSTLDGAKTLEPGQAQIGMAVSLQRGGNPLSYSGIPIPQMELAGRVGVADDVDVGFRAYLLGAAFDVRYRFWHHDRFHLATAPGLGFFAIPGVAGGQGSLEMRTPVLAEWEIGKAFSWSGGPRLITRDQWNGVSFEGGAKGSQSRLDVFAGVGTRAEVHSKTFAVGASVDLMAEPARHGGLAWSAGLDVALRSGAPKTAPAASSEEQPKAPAGPPGSP